MYYLFKRYIFDQDSLLKYGFIEKDGNYQYQFDIDNGNISCILLINNQDIEIKVIDNEFNDEVIGYKNPNLHTKYLIELRNKIDEQLIIIRDNCFKKNYFIFPTANLITDYIKEKYQSEPAFLWESYPDCGVFKKKNNKWFGIIMNVDYKKIDQERNGEIEVLNVKINPADLNNLLLIDGIYLAYHMNKKYWISIVLDGRVNDQIIKDLIDKSYKLIKD